jgi:hypothetical protein
MSAESFALVDKWQKGDHEDDFPEVEMETLWTGRKENHIHSFVEGEVGDVDNCEYLPVTKGDVERLVERLTRVNEDHELAGALLPTQAGFFFGSTDYDEWYFNDIETELEAFKEILDGWDEDAVYTYWAWW